MIIAGFSSCSSWCGLAALLALSQSTGFWPILICSMAFALAWTTIMPLTETVALSGVKVAGLDYGRMRLWGSLSFIAATLCGGWVVGHYGAASAIWLVVAGGVLTTACGARACPADRARAAEGGDHAAAAALGRSTGPAALAAVSRLLAGGGRDAGGACDVLHLRHAALGQRKALSADWSGALWAIGVIAEIAAFQLLGAASAARSGGRADRALRGAAAVVRWLAMGFDPPLAWLAAAAGAARADIRRGAYRRHPLHGAGRAGGARAARRRHSTPR